MIRKFLARLVPKGGLNPDMTLDPLVKGDEAPSTLLPESSAKDAAIDVHPDLDWDIALFEPPIVATQEPDLDLLDPAMSLNKLRQEEDAAAEILERLEDSDLPSKVHQFEIDWSLELAWAGASGETGAAGATDRSWGSFDFDLADQGPEPEASAEETLSPSETASARERRLDGAAADLVLSLGAFRSADRRALHRRFRTVVEEFRHPASHAALHRLLAEGASLEEVEEATQLRCFWRDQPWLWAQKRFVLSSWSVRRSPSQRLAFGWPTAMRLVRTFGLVETERAIAEDWFDAWADLNRSKAISPVQEMAFFTYAGFLRQLTPDIPLENPEGVEEEVADRRQVLELRDCRSDLVWQFERKLEPRDGEFSLEPARIRNHRVFEEASAESRFGLSELVALAPAESMENGFCRRYHFPVQPFDGAKGSRVQVSSLSCHGHARIVGLNLEARHVTLAVPRDQKRLLETHIALISEPPATLPIVTEE